MEKNVDLDGLMEEMDKMEEKKVISETEKERRVEELQRIRELLLSRVKDEVVTVKEVGRRGTPQVEIEGEKIKCLRGFGFSIAHSNQGVGENDEWDETLGGESFLDAEVAGTRGARIHFVLTTDSLNAFVYEPYLPMAITHIFDEELVELLSVVPTENGEIDNFEEFRKYVQWYMGRYIQNKKNINTKEQQKKKKGFFQKIQERGK